MNTKTYIIILIFLISTKTSFTGSADRYIPVQHKYYSFIEYQALNSDSIGLFMLNQPYKFSDLKKIATDPAASIYFRKFILAGFGVDTSDSTTSNFAINISPGVMGYSDKNYREISRAVLLDGAINFHNVNLVNRIKLDPSVKYDPDFHGDTGEWLMGYFENSYLNVSLNNNLEFFAGRVGRNFGIINDYGLILSNNPYNFDHFGFKTNWNNLQYSFYFTRLNDMTGRDSQGVIIPIGETVNCHRYWSIQRLDWAINSNFQIALSEATIYGGPDQDFVAAYLNPVNFFYASQRNQGYQMSGLWDLAAFYRPVRGIGIYLDLFADDLIVNNEPVNDSGKMPREVYPDRLGINAKISFTDLFFNYTLASLRYVRIWNDTYISFRNFENYLFFNKSMGFPKNSYESVKVSFTKFIYPELMLNLNFESWRRGDREITDIFKGEKEKFPADRVWYGHNISIAIRQIIFDKFDLELDYSSSLRGYTFKSTFQDPQVEHIFKFKLYYHFLNKF